MDPQKEPLIHSDLSGPYPFANQTFEITISRLPDSDWLVRISGKRFLDMTLDSLYPSEESAYAAALEAVHECAEDSSSINCADIEATDIDDSP